MKISPLPYFAKTHSRTYNRVKNYDTERKGYARRYTRAYFLSPVFFLPS